MLRRAERLVFRNFAMSRANCEGPRRSFAMSRANREGPRRSFAMIGVRIIFQNWGNRSFGK